MLIKVCIVCATVLIKDGDKFPKSVQITSGLCSDCKRENIQDIENRLGKNIALLAKRILEG